LLHDNLITDRSIVDAFVYATWGFLNNKFTYEEHEMHKRIFLSCIGEYDIFFYIAPEFPIIQDEVRDTDSSYQAEIHRLFKVTFSMYKIPYVILSGSNEQRLQTFSTIFEWPPINI
jgi:hypothetical protein